MFSRLRRLAERLSWRRIRFSWLCRSAAWKYRRSRGKYNFLTEDRLKASRKSDTVFIFGSGSSINDISAWEWKHFESCDTLSFNWFVHQNFIRIDYHLIREVCSNDLVASVWKKQLNEYAGLIRNNSHYRNTRFIVQADPTALNTFRLVNGRMLPSEAELFEFKTRSKSLYEPPSESFYKGLVHGPSSLFDCINFAFLMGWEKIVLVGVDLYDRRYFWLGEGQLRPGDAERGASIDMAHNTSGATTGYIGKWKDELALRGVVLEVYNPRSLLAGVLDVYPERPDPG